MDPNFLPESLKTKCGELVRMTHKKYGLRGLPAKITGGEYVVALSCMSDTFEALQTVSSFFKYQIVAAVAAAVCLVLSFTVAWWLLIGAAVGVFVAMWSAKVVRAAWWYLATVLLGLEVLTTDFCGWGKAYPDLHRRALELLNDNPAQPKTVLLDHYLPRRANFTSDTARGFGPGGAE